MSQPTSRYSGRLSAAPLNSGRLCLTGVGFPQSVTKTLTVTPLLYGVIGESGEEGVAVGATVTGSIKRLKLSGFAGHFEPVNGPIGPYTFVDTMDGIVEIKKDWELGVSGKLLIRAGKAQEEWARF